MILQKVTARVNAINNDSSKSEESFLEDFQTFKKSFLAKVNVFKKQLLTSYTTDNVNKSNNSDRLIILLEENIAFLKEQLNKKDKVIDSLLNQLSKQNDSAPHNKTSNTISTQTELITDSKLTESSKKSEKSNTDRVKKENKNKTHIDPKQSTPLHKNADSASTKENAPIGKIIHRSRAVTSTQKARNR